MSVEILSSNPLAWGMYYAPDHFTDVSPTFHIEILRAALKYQYLAVVAPRGSSKSTLLTFLLPAHSICNKRHRHIVMLQSTFAAAARSIATIAEVLRREEVRKDYGIAFEKDSNGEIIISHPDGFKTRVIGKGAEQMAKVRGEKFEAYRPDLIIVDDLEDDVTAVNQELRAQCRDLFNRAVVKSVNKSKHQIIAIGTIFHDDCLIARLVHKDYYPDYKKLFYQVRISRNIFNPVSETYELEETSLWPERWSMAEIKQDEIDDPDTFSTEMMNNPASGTSAKFRKVDFREWRKDGGQYVLYDGEGRVCAKGALRDCQWGIACDLAWEERRTSDFSVAMPGYLTPDNNILVGEYLCKKGLRPDELFEWLFVCAERLKKETGSNGFIGFEKAKLEKVVKWLLEKEMRRRGEYLLLKDLIWDADKLQRIYTRLQPRYAQHAIFHQKGMEELEYQLIRIPSGTHDDLPDTLQGLCQLLQYPKEGAKTEKLKTAETEFNWWRKAAIDAKLGPREKGSPFPFGKKKPAILIPTTKSYR
jgi:hypothetical protein